MKRILILIMLTAPVSAFADYLDVIEVQLNDGCSFSEYLAIKNDFNSRWASKYGYQSEVIMPIQSHNLVSFYWVGRSVNAEAFGKAWDAWRTEIMQPDTVAAKLWERFKTCSTNVSRRGYDVY